jgi:hypothetical protein
LGSAGFGGAAAPRHHGAAAAPGDRPGRPGIGVVGQEPDASSRSEDQQEHAGDQVDHDLRRRHIAQAVWRLATRGQLLLGALEILNTEAEHRARERLATSDEPPGTRATVRGVLLELLPLDEERRNRQLVYAAYFVRFLTDPELTEAARNEPHALEDLVAGLLVQGQQRGEVPQDVDPPPDRAVALVDHQLDRLFPSR